MPLNFIADRPFLFVIHEKVSNSVLFLGKFVDPSQWKFINNKYNLKDNIKHFSNHEYIQKK